jgi:diphthamide biosynthesis methyltransferase
MLHLVGLGLADETDITVRGLEIVKRAERVYLEAYTSILLVDKSKLVSSNCLNSISQSIIPYHMRRWTNRT